MPITRTDVATLSAAKTLATLVSSDTDEEASSDEAATAAAAPTKCPRCARPIAGNTTKFDCKHVFCKSCSMNKTHCLDINCNAPRKYNNARSPSFPQRAAANPLPSPPIPLTFSAGPVVAQPPAPVVPPPVAEQEAPRKRIKYPMQVETTLAFATPVKCPLCAADAPEMFVIPRLLRDHLMTTHTTAEEKATMFFHVNF